MTTYRKQFFQKARQFRALDPSLTWNAAQKLASDFMRVLRDLHSSKVEIEFAAKKYDGEIISRIGSRKGWEFDPMKSAWTVGYYDYNRGSFRNLNIKTLHRWRRVA